MIINLAFVTADILSSSTICLIELLFHSVIPLFSGVPSVVLETQPRARAGANCKEEVVNQVGRYTLWICTLGS
jgi:hypothetical protein